ncbi:MAG TPA: DUF2911 domain-containing protein [Thermoanaerobaculia bacterium]|nr:DUF2911 domain-containing protein [Thermoanaerobaculia bacterium]
MPNRCAARPLAAFVLAVAAPLALAAVPALAQAGPPRPSPKATVSQVVGITEIAIAYSSPSVRGREIWGALVPWGKVWRTGANEATTFAVSSDVMVEGKPLPAGTYALFTIPNQDHWTLIFNKQSDQWGAFKHDPAQDALRVDVKPVQSNLQERMQFLFSESDDGSAEVMLRWENVAVPFTVTVDTPKLALAKAEKELAAADAKRTAFVSWARWLQEHDVAADRALVWAEKGAAGDDGAKSYWAQAVLARLQAKAGHAKEARAAAERALAAAATDKAEGVAADADKLRQEMTAWGK